MPTSTKPRRSHGYLRRQRPNAIAMALGARQTFTEAEQVRLALPVRAAFEAMRRGAGTLDLFATLAMAVNLALICAEKIGPEAEGACLAARDALQRVRVREYRCSKWGFSGEEAGAVLVVLDLFEQLTGLLTAEQLRAAVKEYQRRVSAGEHLGKVGNG
jgi:hypothetical protein